MTKFQNDLQKLNDGEISTKEAIDILEVYSKIHDLKHDIQIKVALETGKAWKELQEISAIVSMLCEYKLEQQKGGDNDTSTNNA